MSANTRRVIRADGTEAVLAGPVTIREAAKLIKAPAGLDTVQLRHLGGPARWVMLVDDLGHPAGLPVNHKATALYRANCRPGTQHEIRGDVIVTLDGDFGGRL